MFQLLGAITIAASPRFGPVSITAIFARVRISDLEEIKILLPVKPFLLQGSRAKADFHPGANSIICDTGLGHVVQVLITRHGTLAERARFDSRQKSLLLARPHLRFDYVTHT